MQACRNYVQKVLSDIDKHVVHNHSSLLQVGDQILEVNGQSFVTISHDEAVHILKTGYNLLMNVRDVARLPHACTVVDEPKCVSSRGIMESSAPANPSAVPNTTISSGIHGSGSSSNCCTR